MMHTPIGCGTSGMHVPPSSHAIESGAQATSLSLNETVGMFVVGVGVHGAVGSVFVSSIASAASEPPPTHAMSPVTSIGLPIAMPSHAAASW